LWEVDWSRLRCETCSVVLWSRSLLNNATPANVSWGMSLNLRWIQTDQRDNTFAGSRRIMKKSILVSVATHVRQQTISRAICEMVAVRNALRAHKIA